jgi:hypothetical protein
LITQLILQAETLAEIIYEIRVYDDGSEDQVKLRKFCKIANSFIRSPRSTFDTFDELVKNLGRSAFAIKWEWSQSLNTCFLSMPIRNAGK